MSTTVSIRLPKEEAAGLQRLAEKTGRSKSEVIRDALRKLTEKDNDPRRAVLRKLAGSVSGPADLSSREGFVR